MAFDVFLCHNSKDKPAVRAVGQKLRDAGLRPWLDEWELEAGQRFRKELEAQLAKVPAAAVLVGADGMGPWQDLEIDALLIEMVGRGCRVIPVLLESCPAAPELPLFLRGLVWVDLRETATDPILKLIRGIRAALPTGVSGKGKLPVNNLPSSLGDLFTGREPLLAELEKSLGQPGATALVQAQTVSGLGGVGKTRLAIELAYRHAGDYSAIFLVNADSPAELRRNLAGLAELWELDLKEPVLEDQAVEAVKRTLRKRPGWLLILDNVDTEDAQAAVSSLLPLGAGQVLITSRLQHWPQTYKQLEVDKLDPQSARDYLLKATADRPQRGADLEAATQLAEKLEYLPLALELTAAYLKQNASSLREILEGWAEEEKTLLDWRGPGSTEYPRSLAATWARSFEKLNEDAQVLLYILGHLAPEPIAVAMFEAGSKVLNEAVGGRELKLKEALADLQRYSLIRRENSGKNKTITLHRLVQAVARGRIASEEKVDWVQRVLRLILAYVPKESPEDVRTWGIWDPLRPHATRVLELAEEVGAPQPASDVMTHLGELLFGKALYSEAEPLMRRALQIDEANFGPDHPKVAGDLNNLAMLLQATNHLAGAEPLMRRALQIDETSFGPDHPNVAIRLNNLASLLQANRLAEAEPLMRRALKIDETSFGPDHPKVAIRLNNLAGLFLATDRLAQAEPLVRRALQIDETSFGPDHPNVAVRLHNLAMLLQGTNRLAEAEPLMRRALVILESSLGAAHPRTVMYRGNLEVLLAAIAQEGN